jgi:hypothetical protein
VISRGTQDFWKLYWTLSEEVRTAARVAYKKFQQNAAHPSLQLERMRSDRRFWSVRVTRDYRAVAQRFPDDTWVWIWIGTHRDFDRQFPA